ncbi:MAG: hypothetical protein IPK72_08590 [Candidatus Eisenbacteria bacterium]|nr:hypothetical protein [Candidatus Eisenbacteria bacterium]
MSPALPGRAPQRFADWVAAHADAWRPLQAVTQRPHVAGGVGMVQPSGPAARDRGHTLARFEGLLLDALAAYTPPRARSTSGSNPDHLRKNNVDDPK